MVHTEKVHVMFGLLAAIGGASALRTTWKPGSRLRLVWPAVALLLGIALFIPVEGHTLTYEPLGWWATIASAIPTDRVNWIPNWIDTLSVRHVLQHKVGAAAVIVLAVVEALRGSGRLKGRAWDSMLPLMLIAIGLAFGIHGNSAEHLPSIAEQVHHWILGVVLTFGGTTLGLARLGALSHRHWHAIWAAGVLFVGLDIAVFYRLDSTPSSAEAHQHESPGPRVR
jgi:hypothetical protein